MGKAALLESFPPIETDADRLYAESPPESVIEEEDTAPAPQRGEPSWTSAQNNNWRGKRRKKPVVEVVEDESEGATSPRDGPGTRKLRISPSMKKQPAATLSKGKSSYLLGPNLAASFLDRWCPVFNPYNNNPYGGYWDFVLLVALTYVALVTPYTVAFVQTDQVDFVWVLDRMVDITFIFDMMLRFNSAYKDKAGVVVFDRGMIGRHYLKGLFMIDVFSMVPMLSILVQFGAWDLEDTSFLKLLRIVRLLRLSKLIRLVRTSKIVQQLEAERAINYSLAQLYGFLFFLFYLSHILACGWYLVLVLEDNKECIYFTTYLESQECCYNWWSCHGPINIFSTVSPAGSNARKYFISYSWAIGAMLTVGSNITAATDAERAYEMVVNVIAGLVYAYLIGTVVAIFNTMTKSTLLFFEKMDNLNHALSLHKIDEANPELCMELRTFYRYRHTYFDEDTNTLGEVMNNLTDHLRRQVAKTVYAEQISALDIFADFEMPEAVIGDLSAELELAPYGPSEQLIQVDDPADRVMFVLKGAVMSQATVNLQGDMLGTDAIYNPRASTRRGYIALSMTHGIVCTLMVDRLERILHQPRHLALTVQPLRRITVGRCAWVLREVVKIFQVSSSLNYSTSVSKVIEYYTKLARKERDTSPYVPLNTVIKLFINYWTRRFPVRGKALAFLRIRLTSKLTNDRYRKMSCSNRMIQHVSNFLGEYNSSALQEETLATHIVMKEKLVLEDLQNMSAIELHAVGLAMGTARIIVEDRHYPKRRQEKLRRQQALRSLGL